jgi:hypothetical protein
LQCRRLYQFIKCDDFRYLGLEENSSTLEH